MPRTLLSLNALRTFEAVARHRSLAKAARELNVTAAAVSHQVRSLEAELGIDLFEYKKGKFTLGSQAREALPVLQEAFGLFAEATRRLRVKSGVTVLNVNACPTFAAKWLVPRLGKFQALSNDIDVHLNSTEQLADFDGVDVTIRLGGGEYPGFDVVQLFEGDLFAVCHPDLLERGPPLKSPADLAHHTLLHVNWSWIYDDPGLMVEDTKTWEEWLNAVGVNDVHALRGPRFSQIDLALGAAIEGQGVALANDILVAEELASGKLVRLFDVSAPRGYSYYMVYPKDSSRGAQVRPFYDWILSEIRAQAPLRASKARKRSGR